jgi:hypothetical protein
MDENDDVRETAMQLRLDAMGFVFIRLPNMQLSCFERRITSDGFDDSYIMDLLVRSRYNFSVQHVMDTLHDRIVLRGAFRKLYFRSFRKAFAPNRRQGKRAVEELSRVLDDYVFDSKRSRSALTGMVGFV